MNIFKIRDRETGLFSTGGMSPGWSKKGKTWTARGHVTSHLTQFNSNPYGRGRATTYDNADVVEFEVVETEEGTIPVNDWKPTAKTLRAKELDEIRRVERDAEYQRQKLCRLENEAASLRAKLNKD